MFSYWNGRNQSIPRAERIATLQHAAHPQARAARHRQLIHWRPGDSAATVGLRRTEEGCRNIPWWRPGLASPQSTGSRAPAPTSAPPGSRPEHKSPHPKGSCDPAPTAKSPGARSPAAREHNVSGGGARVWAGRVKRCDTATLEPIWKKHREHKVSLTASLSTVGRLKGVCIFP